MKLLLDTHIALWYMTDDARLSRNAKAWISNGENAVFYSIVSVWEVAIKRQSKAHSMPVSDAEFVNYAEETGFQDLPLTKEHIAALKTLHLNQSAKEHHDPFDRILISQAKVEKMLFLTHDERLSGYEENCVLVI